MGIFDQLVIERGCELVLWSKIAGYSDFRKISACPFQKFYKASFVSPIVFATCPFLNINKKSCHRIERFCTNYDSVAVFFFRFIYCFTQKLFYFMRFSERYSRRQKIKYIRAVVVLRV